MVDEGEIAVMDYDFCTISRQYGMGETISAIPVKLSLSITFAVLMNETYFELKTFVLRW